MSTSPQQKKPGQNKAVGVGKPPSGRVKKTPHIFQPSAFLCGHCPLASAEFMKRTRLAEETADKQNGKSQPALPPATGPLGRLPASMSAYAARWLSPKEAHAYSLTTRNMQPSWLSQANTLCAAWTADGTRCSNVDDFVRRRCHAYCAAACPGIVSGVLRAIQSLNRRSYTEREPTIVRLGFPASGHEYSVPFDFSYTQEFTVADHGDYEHWHHYANRGGGWEYGAHFTLPGYLSGEEAIEPIAAATCHEVAAGRAYRVTMYIDLEYMQDRVAAQALDASLMAEVRPPVAPGDHDDDDDDEPWSEEKWEARQRQREERLSRLVDFVWLDPEASPLNALHWGMRRSRNTTAAFELVGRPW